MFIYADESGNSGRNLFDEAQPIYRQAAILTLADAEAVLEPVIRPELESRGLARLHANELRPHEVAAIAARLIDVLDAAAPWEFHVTLIHKPYLATTKFVDTVFDAGENVGARSLWYNLEFFRHTICCAIDEMLTCRNREKFWSAFLTDDVEGIKASIRNAQTYLDRRVNARRLREVIRDAFHCALGYPEELTLSAAATRRAYKGHTPNMVAFSSLLHAINDFAHVNASPPVAFYHDEQQEFGTTMRETHEFLGPIHRVNTGRMMPDLRRVDYDLAPFAMPSSKELVALQAVDMLLWVEQRDNGEPALAPVKMRLSGRTNAFYISRGMSELIVRSWLRRISGKEMSAEQLMRGQELARDIEQKHLERLAEFERQKRGGSA
jgi:hypothetical protein